MQDGKGHLMDVMPILFRLYKAGFQTGHVQQVLHLPVEPQRCNGYFGQELPAIFHGQPRWLFQQVVRCADDGGDGGPELVRKRVQ